MNWAIPIANLVFATAMMIRAYRERRILTFYWALAAYFAGAILFDIASAPFGPPYGLLPVFTSQDAVARVSIFVFGCNLLFAAGGAVVNALFPRKTVAFQMTERDWLASGLMWFYLVLFIVGAVWYLPRIATYSYIDFVSDGRNVPAKQTFFASMPLGPLAILRRRYWLAALPVLATLVIVVITHVRDPLLQSAFPIVLVTMLSPWPIPARAKKIMRVCAVLSATALLGFGAYIMFLRMKSVSLPEFELTRGMYLVVQQVDAGAKKTGFNSVEIATKSIFWPVYNRHIVDDYKLPEEPPSYMARLTLEHMSFDSSGCHFPFLWYSDAYLSMGWLGMLQGLLWGALLASCDVLVRKNPVVWAATLPILTWIIYMFNRGVVSGSFPRGSPQVYAQIVILLGGFAWAEIQMRNKRPLRANNLICNVR